MEFQHFNGKIGGVALKAFFFSIDALIAVGVALSFITLISLSTSSTQQFNEYYLFRTAQSSLAVMDADNTFSTILNMTPFQAKPYIEVQLRQLLPQNIDARMEVDVYSCSDSACNNFILSNRLFGQQILSTTSSKVGVAQRVFSFPGSSWSNSYFEIAKIQVWFDNG
jgi:hypothetical protein